MVNRRSRKTNSAKRQIALNTCKELCSLDLSSSTELSENNASAELIGQLRRINSHQVTILITVIVASRVCRGVITPLTVPEVQEKTSTTGLYRN